MPSVRRSLRDNPELHKVLPWTGTNRGPQRIVDVFNDIGRVWETKAFEVRDVVANEHSVAMFGSFTYKTRMPPSGGSAESFSGLSALPGIVGLRFFAGPEPARASR